MDLSFLSNLTSLGIFDSVLILIIFAFTVYGFMRGIIRMVGELVGYVAGIWVAGHYFLQFYDWTQSVYMGNENVGRMISFLLLLFITRKLVLVLIIVIDKFFHLLSVIPFFGMVNRIAGAVFGLVTVNVVLGILIYFASRYSLGFAIDKMIVSSGIAPTLLRFGEFVSPLLPEIMRSVHSIL